MKRSIAKLLVYLLICSLLIEGIKSDTIDESNTSNSTELQNEGPEVPRPIFRLGPIITDWDEQRAKWLEENPGMRLNRKGKPRMILLSSSSTDPCPSPKGDYYLLKATKNKVDYSQLHDIELYHNMVIMDTAMQGFFIKHPLVRKLMVSHPEAEWIWWMDGDAFFTDMTFEIPLEKYKDHNLVLHGWDKEIYEQKNWVGLNAGIFLIRNCQWSLNALDTWAAMGEDYDDHLGKMGNLSTQMLRGRPEFFPIDDQSALVYLLVTSQSDGIKSKVFLENSYALHGYWVWAVKKLDELLKSSQPRIAGEEYWPFITHFVGCKSCSGSYATYDKDLCLLEMEKAFNVADNQMLHIFGFEHENVTSPQVRRTRPDSHLPLADFWMGALDFLRKHPWSGAVTRRR